MRRWRLTLAIAITALSGAGVAHADAGSVPNSEYTGTYYVIHPNEKFRKCVAWRESRNTLTATSRGGHMGLYQFTDELADGASWMMRLDPIDPISKRQRLWLERTPMRQWPRYWQDRAFYTVLNVLGADAGAKHWYISGSPCNKLGGM